MALLQNFSNSWWHIMFCERFSLSVIWPKSNKGNSWRFADMSGLHHQNIFKGFSLKPRKIRSYLMNGDVISVIFMLEVGTREMMLSYLDWVYRGLASYLCVVRLVVGASVGSSVVTMGSNGVVFVFFKWFPSFVHCECFFLSIKIILIFMYSYSSPV